MSCHRNSLVTAAVVTARSHGFRVDEQAVSAERTQIAQYLESWRERTLQNDAIAGSQEPGLRRGVEFLLRTQLVDGSWLVKSRAVPIQAYFESGFTHGADQWISAAGTAWAVRALAANK